MLYTKDGPIEKSLALKLQSNFGATLAHLKEASYTTGSEMDSVASTVFDNSSPLYHGLQGDQRAIATSLARTLEIGFGLALEDTSLTWSNWSNSVAFAGSDGAIVGGYSKLTAALYEAVVQSGKGDFKLDSPVSRVSRTESGVIAETDGGKKYSAKIVLSTIPLGVLQTLPESFFHPPLPPRRRIALSRTNVGVLEKVALSYPSAWWPPAQSFTLLSDEGAIVASPLPYEPATLFIYLSHPFAKLSPAAVHTRLASALAPGKDVPAHTASISSGWITDKYALGATSTPVKTGDGRTPLDWSEAARPLWEGTLRFAGEATDIDQ